MMMKTAVSPTSTATGRKRWLFLAVLVIVVLAGAVLRFDGVADRTMGHMELYTPNIDLPERGSVPLPRTTFLKTAAGAVQEAHPPAWYLSMYPYTKLFGTGLFALRLPSVLFGLASIILLYLLGTRVEDRLTALLAAALLAFNGQHILWSQLARPQIVACFLGLLTTLLLVQALRAKKRQRLLLGLYLGFSLYGLATTYYFWMFFVTHVAWAFLRAWAREERKLGLLQWQVLVLILGSPLITLSIYQSRDSYLGSSVLAFLGDFLQFGFLFVPDLDPQLPSVAMEVSLIVLGLLVLGLGLAAGWRSQAPERGGAEIAPPSLKLLALAAALAFLFIPSFTLFFRRFPRMNPERMQTMLISSVIPLLMLLGVFLLRRYWPGLRQKLKSGPMVRRTGDAASLISLLAVLPVLMVVGISLFMPFFASRHAMLFVPFLLLVLSRGLVWSGRRAWQASPALALVCGAVLVFFLAGAHYRSIEYNSQRYHRVDYEGLAEEWIPDLRKADLVFLEAHWGTSPVYYYFNGERYRLIFKDYDKHLAENPDARIWLLTVEGVPTEEAKEALAGYEPQRTIRKKRIEVKLYERQKQAVRP